MKVTVATRKLIARLTLCALVFVCLIPTISQTLSRSARLPWLELCTAAGVKRASPQDAPAGVPTARDDHCPFCRLQHDLPFLPTPAAAQLSSAAPATATASRPQERLHAPVRWAVAPSRAPPAFS